MNGHSVLPMLKKKKKRRGAGILSFKEKWDNDSASWNFLVEMSPRILSVEPWVWKLATLLLVKLDRMGLGPVSWEGILSERQYAADEKTTKWKSGELDFSHDLSPVAGCMALDIILETLLSSCEGYILPREALFYLSSMIVTSALKLVLG